jgi:hypothetical protein
MASIVLAAMLARRWSLRRLIVILSIGGDAWSFRDGDVVENRTLLDERTEKHSATNDDEDEVRKSAIRTPMDAESGPSHRSLLPNNDLELHADWD